MESSYVEQALREYKEGVGAFEKDLPEIARQYMKFTEACFEEGELSVKNKHLIAVALGVMTNDEYCIIYHTKGALDQGAGEREVMEAAAVAGAFGGGLAMSQTVTLLRDVLEEFGGGGSPAGESIKH
ncbi:carboxymuconolactone decarboxylase family protein [Kroppenstedtia eburnea]